MYFSVSDRIASRRLVIARPGRLPTPPATRIPPVCPPLFRQCSKFSKARADFFIDEQRYETAAENCTGNLVESQNVSQSLARRNPNYNTPSKTTRTHIQIMNGRRMIFLHLRVIHMTVPVSPIHRITLCPLYAPMLENSKCLQYYVVGSHVQGLKRERIASSTPSVFGNIL